ncbi:MAG: methyltransferase family protein [Hyphomonas sp.]
MSLRIPPLAQFLACGALGWGLSRLLPEWSHGSSLWTYAGYGLIAVGITLLAIALLAFARARTTVNPLSPEQAETLVTTGLYRFTRNPMYLAMALILFGGALTLGSIAALAAPAIFVVAMTILQIKPEERALESRFGKAFTVYRGQTRRWL